MLGLHLDCNTPGCESRVDFPEELIMHGDEIEHGAEIADTLHYDAKKLGWHSDLDGTWCRKCATQREVSRLDRATAMGL